jgi:hypothetical protein
MICQQKKNILNDPSSIEGHLWIGGYSISGRVLPEKSEGRKTTGGKDGKTDGDGIR